MVYGPTPAEIDDLQPIYARVGDREFLYHEIAPLFPYPMRRMQRFEDRGWFKSRPPGKGAKPRVWRFTQGAIALLRRGERSGHARTPA